MRAIMLVVLLLVVSGCAQEAAWMKQQQLESARHQWLLKNPWAIGRF